MSKIYSVRVFIQQPMMSGILRNAGCFEAGKVVGGFYDFKVAAEKAMTVAEQEEFLNLLLKRDEIVYAQMCKRFILSQDISALSNGYKFVFVSDMLDTLKRAGCRRVNIRQ